MAVGLIEKVQVSKFRWLGSASGGTVHFERQRTAARAQSGHKCHVAQRFKATTRFIPNDILMDTRRQEPRTLADGRYAPKHIRLHNDSCYSIMDTKTVPLQTRVFVNAK